jgi:hypothetical protein
MKFSYTVAMMMGTRGKDEGGRIKDEKWGTRKLGVCNITRLKIKELGTLRANDEWGSVLDIRNSILGTFYDRAGRLQ